MFPEGIVPLDFNFQFYEGSIYLTMLGTNLACAEIEISPYKSLTKDDYHRFHQFLLMQGVWSDEDFSAAEAILKNPPVATKAEFDEGSGYCEVNY